MIARQSVTSSLIKSVGIEDGVMHVEFQNGRVYEYRGPKVKAHHEGMMTAESIGKYFGQHVRNCKDTFCQPVKEST